MAKIIAAAIALGLILSGCGTPAQITHAPPPSPAALPLGADVKPIQFRQVLVKMNRGQHMGALQTGLLCGPHSDLTYKGGRQSFNDDEFTDVFREELLKANYPVVGDPRALFEDPSLSRAELTVAGLVTDLKANICYPYAPWGDFVRSKGEAALTVEWQIYSNLDRRVVHKTVTRGTGQVAASSPHGASGAYHAAFAEATRGLLADETFRALVTRAPTQPAAVAAPRTLVIPRVNAHAGPLTSRIADVQAGVVLVRAGMAHGSGFFITADGYVLTNAHVVEEARFVRLKLTTGREIPGEVVATDPRRDVALVKAQGGGFVPLPLAVGEPIVGSEVYAFGAPLDERLYNTVTRGIVSSYRVEDGMKFLQSDVNIQPGSSGGPITDPAGNVVAISVKGRVNRGVFVGINYFIPIADAMQTMGITFRDGVAAGN